MQDEEGVISDLPPPKEKITGFPRLRFVKSASQSIEMQACLTEEPDDSLKYVREA
jgi:hypothetical protein